MVAKTLWVSALVVALLGVGGLGFAAFTASYTVNLNATGGTLSVSVGEWNEAVSMPYVGCSVSGSGSNWVNFSVGPLAPGDWCSVFNNVSNSGNVGANITANTVRTGTCFQDHMEFPTAGQKNYMAPGASEPFQATIELTDTSGNECQGATGTFTIVFNAVAETGENGEPTGL